MYTLILSNLTVTSGEIWLINDLRPLLRLIIIDADGYEKCIYIELASIETSYQINIRGCSQLVFVYDSSFSRQTREIICQAAESGKSKHYVIDLSDDDIPRSMEERSQAVLSADLDDVHKYAGMSSFILECDIELIPIQKSTTPLSKL